MIAGGMGRILHQHIFKQELKQDDLIIVLGGPSFLIGLGRGSASSQHGSDIDQALDFASVQRANPEIQRRAQEVIDACVRLENSNPILSIHDVGAGGLCNAVPELVFDHAMGAFMQLRSIPLAQPDLTPMEIWCNESQERYVLAIKESSLSMLEKLCYHESCPFALIGQVINAKELRIYDDYFNNYPVDVPMALFFEKMPQLQINTMCVTAPSLPFQQGLIKLSSAIERVLQLPCVADKSFLITIGDPSVGGLVARDQIVGPWQVPVADVAVSLLSDADHRGMTMAIGERAPIALLQHAASARMAVSEAITNLLAADIDSLSSIELSANWMSAAGFPGEAAGLYDAVEAIGLSLCPQLGIPIPVGKDSMSMRMS
jgi:phosphoribosylformylglycinamidine synthase